MSDGACPNSIEVQVDFEQIPVILKRVAPCSPRPEAIPTPELGSMSLDEPHQE